MAPLLFKNSRYDCWVFTDNKKLRAPGWKVVYVEPKKDLALQSREIKLMVHKFAPKYGVYFYIDANYQVRGNPYEYQKRYFKAGLLLHRHGTRDCIFKEGVKIKQLGLADPGAVDRQLQTYSMEGMKRGYGLFQNGILIRDSSVNDFMEAWYDQLTVHTHRDQLSLPYLLWKQRPEKVQVIQPFFIRRLMVLLPHKKANPKLEAAVAADIKKVKRPKVYYFTPGRGDKNLGKAYNDHVALAPKDAWICIRDGDTMFLNPFWSRQIEDIILKHGKRYPLISCVTNRLGLNWQLPFGFSENADVMHHHEIASQLYAEKYDVVTTSQNQTAGLFMLFPKATWEKVKFRPGLTNGGTFVDFSFANDVMKRIGKIGIAQGLYLFHFYRLDKGKKYTEHLY